MEYEVPEGQEDQGSTAYQRGAPAPNASRHSASKKFLRLLRQTDIQLFKVSSCESATQHRRGK